MRYAVIPLQMVEQRRRLGEGDRDETWEGVLHWVEAGNAAYGELRQSLLAVLHRVAASHGCRVGGGRLLDPAIADDSDYRVPALMVYDDAACSERGVEGSARLVVEIAEPDGESYEKVPFYSRAGAGELLIVDRDTKSVRRWEHGGDGLVEAAPTDDGWHVLAGLPGALQGGDGRLRVRTDAGVEEL